jgi:signal transduction histidine kinase
MNVDIPPREEMDPSAERPRARERSLLSSEVTFQNATLEHFSRPAIGARARDLLVALVAFGLTLLLLGAGDKSRGLDPLGAVVAAFACFPLLARRRAPLAVLAVTTLASSVLDLLGYTLGPPFGPTFALFFVAVDERTRGRIRETVPLVLALFAIHVGSAASTEHGFPTSPVLFGVLVWGGAWVVGDQVRQRRRRIADLVDRAHRTERDTQRERQLAAAEERTRIARDLHDSAAHAINVILVQAGAARLLQQRDPAAVRNALTTIEDVARETIGEIDQLVRTLRDDNQPHEAIEPPTGLAALETLVERHGAAGLPVEIHREGNQRSLTPAIDQAAYRILQESLTNAARHGNGSAEIAIHYSESELELTVLNPVRDGAPGDPEDGGHGILGMRERAALLGGSLETHRVDGRFRVNAHIPYSGAEQQ